MTTTKTTAKPKSAAKRTRKTKPTYPIKVDEPAFYAKALNWSGRFALAGILLRAAFIVLLRGKALV
jgi:hypothetical protein